MPWRTLMTRRQCIPVILDHYVNNDSRLIFETRLVFKARPLYIGWSDVTYLWSQCDCHFVGQHVVLCVVKWWRFVVLFEQNWISWFKKMSVLSLSYWESDVYWRQNNKHFAELAPQNGGKQLIWRNYITATLCISTITSDCIRGPACI